MKSKIVFTLIVLLALFSESCKKDNIKISTDNLIGEWHSEKIEWNGDTLSDEFAWINVGTILGIADKDTYFKNYVSGNWAVQENFLTLSPNDNLELPKQVFKIISVSENTLVLETELTESEYCCDFERFESDEIIRITEHY